MTDYLEQYKPSLFLYAAMAQAQITGIVRAQCIPEEATNIDKIIAGWRKAANAFREIELREQGFADGDPPTEMDSKYSSRLREIQNDVLFKNSFSAYPSDFKVVDIDRLIATQRNVSLVYVDELTKKIPEKPSMHDLIEFCISPKQKVPEPRHYQNDQNIFTFTSPSSDFRFLGGFVKPLDQEDMKYCLGGGLPASALILFIGYGAGSINILRVNNRLILNNGFHRVYALRKRGVTRIPVVVQNIGNPDLEMAPIILGLSKDYLLKHPRPVLVKDFFVEEFTTILRLKNTVRSVKVQWGFDQTEMPI